MPTNCYILLGGVEGPDGYLDSAGMLGLAEKLRELPNVMAASFTWDQWHAVLDPIEHSYNHQHKVVVIGYSGGGSRATYVANAIGATPIDLMVLYDPSPKWQMQPIGHNVKRSICYHNTNPMMFVPLLGELGGGVLIGHTEITIIDIAEQHLLVQTDESLHARTIAAVKEL